MAPHSPPAVAERRGGPVDVLTTTSPWAERIGEHVALVEDTLGRQVDALRRAWLGDTSETDVPYAVDPPAELRRLLAGGGKRTRPVMTFLGWLAGDVEGAGRGHDDMVLAAAALEMLHCFALIHDDVIDESPTRRGQETLHHSATRLHTRHRGLGSSARFGDSVAVLVGDLAHSEADRLAATLPLPMRQVWQQMVLELIAGQLRDVVGSAAGDRRLDFARLVARQKTGYYTVARPLQLGAVAAGAGRDTLAALADYGRHAGEAFALRDDVLGALGDPQLTGKPAGDDIRSGKPTVLLALATESVHGGAATALARAGAPDMTDADVLVVQDAMLKHGVFDAVEDMIDERVRDALAALDPDVLSADGITELTRIVDDLARRGR